MSAASTTAAPQPGAATGIAKRVRANLQTYAILVALILIWIFFYWRTDGAFLAPELLEPVPPDDGDLVPRVAWC